METVVQILHFVNILTAGILAGGSIMVMLVINPAIKSYPGNMSILVHQTAFNLKNDSYMRIMGIICFLSAALILILHHHLNALSVVLYAIAMVLLLVFIIMVQRLAIPTHQKILTWDANSPPAEFPQVRDAFARQHRIRTILSIAFFILFTVAGLASR